MQTSHFTAGTAIPLLFVVVASAAAWAGLAALITGFIQAWSSTGGL